MTATVRTRFLEGLILLLIGLLAALRIYVYVRGGHVLSPLDESVYIDYVLKVPTQGVVHQGEALSTEALQIQACRTWAQTEDLAVACRTHDVSNLSIFPQGGITSADLYTPVYPTITYWGMVAMMALGAADQIVAMRYTGAIWLALGAMGIYLVARRMGLSALAGLGASFAVIAATPIRWANNYVTPDATAMLAGVMMIGVGAWWCRRLEDKASLWIPAITFAVLGAFVTAIKLQNFFAVVVAAFWIAFTVLADHRDRIWSNAALLGKGGIVSILPQVYWVIYRAQTAVGPFPDQQVTEDFSYGLLLAESFRYLPGIGEATGAPTLFGEPWGYWATQWMLMVVAIGSIGSAVALYHRLAFKRLAIATVLTAVVGGPVLVMASSIASHGFIPSPERYGLSLFPAVALGAAAFFDQGRVARLIWAVMGAATAVIWTLIH